MIVDGAAGESGSEIELVLVVETIEHGPTTN